MGQNHINKTIKEQTNLTKSKNRFINVKSNFILKKVFDYIQKNIIL